VSFLEHEDCYLVLIQGAVEPFPFPVGGCLPILCKSIHIQSHDVYVSLQMWFPTCLCTFGGVGPWYGAVWGGTCWLFSSFGCYGGRMHVLICAVLAQVCLTDQWSLHVSVRRQERHCVYGLAGFRGMGLYIFADSLYRQKGEGSVLFHICGYVALFCQRGGSCMLITILVPDGVSSHLSCPVAGGVPLWSIPSLYF
jgi:hypothetical protein